MKAALFRKDGMGAVVGRLKAPNVIQYEDNGSIKVFHLTGAVVDTQFNDVFVLGKKTGENTLEVVRMESIPKEDSSNIGFKAMGEMGPVYCLAIPKGKLTDVEERSGKDNKMYHAMHFCLDKKTTLFFNVLGQYEENPASGCYVFLLKEPLDRQKKEFGVGYAKKEWVVNYGAGYQLMS